MYNQNIDPLFERAQDLLNGEKSPENINVMKELLSKIAAAAAELLPLRAPRLFLIPMPVRD